MERDEPIRKIIHIDMDAFYASVEQRDRVELRGKPVIVGGSAEGRGVVATCSYEARSFGVHSAMASYKAKQLCPDGVFLRPDIEKYRKVSREIHAIFREYTDLVEPLSLDEAYLDVTHNLKGLEFANEVAREIRQAIFSRVQLTASAGISYNKFIAKIASDYHKPNGQTTIPPELGPEFVANLPIKKFFGIGKKSEKKLLDLGIQTGSDLKKFSLPDLNRLFGVRGQYFYNAVRGIDERPLVTNSVRKSSGSETTFSKNSHSLEEMLLFLKSLLDDLVSKWQKNEIRGRCLTVKLKYDNFEVHTRSKTFSPSTNERTLLWNYAETLFTQLYEEGRDVRLIGVTLSRLNEEEEDDSLPLFSLPHL